MEAVDWRTATGQVRYIGFTVCKLFIIYDE